MGEKEVIELMNKEIGIEILDLDTENQWDSLDQVKMLMALDDAFQGKLADIRELQTALTPRKIIDILKTHGLIE